MLHGSGVPHRAFLLCVAQEKRAEQYLGGARAGAVPHHHRMLFGYEIQAAATIGRRFTIHHGYAVVINKFVVAGDDFTIRHAVTIGNRGPNSLACPVIGNNVELGANVVIVGDITIGNNVTIGAGSVVLDSIPDNALVVGEKARVKVIK